MKPCPPDWPRLSTSLCYRDAAAAIDWLVRAFDFQVRLRIEGEGGRIEHSELTYGEAVIMVGQETTGQTEVWKQLGRSPLSVGGANTQTVMLYVDDAEAHCARARAAGARIVAEPAVHDYGADYWADRSYGAMDPEGHIWWITQRLRSPATSSWQDG